MNNYGVIGYPLAHSFSPEYFKQKFLKENIAATYAAFPIEDLNQIRSLVNEKISVVSMLLFHIKKK